MDFNKSDIDYSNCTNAWISGKWINDILLPPEKRGSNPDLFYNAFIRINGVEDKVNYVHDLLKLGQELKDAMMMTGCATLADINPECIRLPHP